MFLWGPLFFLAVESLLKDHFEITWKQWLHLMPGLLGIFSLVTLFVTYDTVGKLELIESTIGERRQNFYDIAVEIASYHMMIYIIAVGVLILYTHRSSHFNYKPLLFVAALLGPAMVLHSIGLRRPDWPGYMAFSLVSTPVLLAMFVTAYTSANVVEEVTDKLRQQRYERSTRLQNIDKDDVERKLDQIMRQKQPFLNSNLRVSALGRMLDLTGPQLSEFINQRYEENFNVYINKFRIEAAKQILIQQPDLDITNIAYNSGFNSISSFNAAFKKNTGTTPGQYRSQTIEPRDVGIS